LGKSRFFLYALICVLATAVVGCQQQINYPAPKLNAKTPLVPADIQAGKPAFTLQVFGGNFTPSSAVTWNNGALSTLFVSTTELDAQIPASLIQNAGTALVTVTTPQPGGGTALPQATFTIDPAPSPVPQITSLFPSGVFAGSAGFTLTVNGTNFTSVSIVTVNGINHSTGFLDSTALQTTILASDVASAGTLNIAVVNPAPNGGASNAFPLSVKNPTPISTSVSPTSATAGGSATTVSVTGSGFVPTSVVLINGAQRATTFASSTSVQAQLTAGDLAAAGMDQIQVANPTPSGGTSNALTFAVNPTEFFGLPVLVDVAPDATQANNGVCGATCTGGIPTLATAGPGVSQTGEFVAFASNSTNLVTSQTNGLSDIFLRNTCMPSTTGSATTGSSTCVPSMQVLSVSSNGAAADGPSSEPSLDSTGTHVAYTSTASNLVSYVTVLGGTRQVYWEPSCSTGTACTPVLVSASSDGTSPGNGDSYNPVVSPDGQYVAFVSLATNLVTNVLADGVTPQVYIRSTCGVIPPVAPGSCTPTTFLVSAPDGTTPGNAPSAHPAISNTGLFVAFESTATNLGATAPNPDATLEVFERSTCVTTGGLASGTCVPVTSIASTPDGATPADGASSEAAVSNDGRFVAFASTAKNLVAGVGPTQEVYVRDTCNGEDVLITACSPSTQLVSTPDGVTAANALSEHPSINGCGVTTTCTTGQVIAFASFATNLGPLASNTQNGIENIFARNSCAVLPTSTTLCVPYTLLVSQPGGTAPPPANGQSVAPAISGDGQTVGFLSFANNLVARDSNALEDVFLGSASLVFNLTVTLEGTGSGTVTDNTSQINCVQTAATSTTPITESGTCTARYISGTSVTLTATAGSGFSFTAWGGTATSVSDEVCSVTAGTTTTGTCSFSMIQNNTATATFK